MVPLQAGGAGGLELLIGLGMFGLIVLGGLAVSVYIYRDAKRRNSSHPLAWGIGAFIGAWWVWALYFPMREHVGPREPTTKGG